MSTKSWKTWWIDRKGMRANHCSRSNQVRGLPRTQSHSDACADGRSGDTALHRACHEGRSEVVRLLLDEKANPSLTNQLGRTPLHLAVNAGDDKIATYLLRAGASQVALDLDGRRPIAAGLANGPSRRQRASSWRTGIKISKTRPQRAHRSSTMHQWSRWRCRMSAQGAYAPARLMRVFERVRCSTLGIIVVMLI